MDSSISLAATDQVQAFKQSISIGDVIITKMDGHPKDFYIYSMVFPSQCFKQ
jgi:signal recognition particle GTPase